MGGLKHQWENYVNAKQCYHRNQPPFCFEKENGEKKRGGYAPTRSFQMSAPLVAGICMWRPAEEATLDVQ